MAWVRKKRVKEESHDVGRISSSAKLAKSRKKSHSSRVMWLNEIKLNQIFIILAVLRRSVQRVAVPDSAA